MSRPLTNLGRVTQSILSRIHNTPTRNLQTAVLDQAAPAIQAQRSTVLTLSATASRYPFYKWNNLWQRDIQNLISYLQIQYYLEKGTLITLDQVGSVLQVPVNVKDRDVFHITIEDYLMALTATIEELARLAPNSVTLGDYARPLQISQFVRDIHAGFQLLNLKNDALRRRSDGIKYNVSCVRDTSGKIGCSSNLYIGQESRRRGL